MKALLASVVALCFFVGDYQKPCETPMYKLTVSIPPQGMKVGKIVYEADITIAPHVDFRVNKEGELRLYGHDGKMVVVQPPFDIRLTRE